ncbi:MAG: HAD family hydrolase [Acholeplasmataceae bacterium]|jgi:phosphoglycolate phosphatase|nr:HAD family hydrolase [Acholeplasmataceae bacterium]
MKKLIIFDLDGTILNTLTDITNSVNYLLKKYNLPLKTEVEIKKYLGKGPRYLLEMAVGKALSELQYQTYYNYYDAHYDIHKMDNTVAYEGFHEVFQTLKKAGFLLAVCSNKQHSATVDLMETLFKGVFDYVIGTTPNIKRKPDSQMVEIIIDQLQVAKKDTLYVGDTEIDMQTAINAQIKKVAVLYGFRERQDLEQFRPDYYINSPKELLDIVKDVF